jgi:hypothetical protein
MSPEPTAPIIEQASSGRAKCRGCGQLIAKGALRLGERLPNPFGEGEMTLWFHLPCAAYKRPAPFLEAIKDTTEAIDNRPQLEQMAHAGPRAPGACRASTASSAHRAASRPLSSLSRAGSRRRVAHTALVYYEEARFEPSGHIHGCAPSYFETADIVERLAHFTPAHRR